MEAMRKKKEAGECVCCSWFWQRIGPLVGILRVHRERIARFPQSRPRQILRSEAKIRPSRRCQALLLAAISAVAAEHEAGIRIMLWTKAPKG